MSLPPTDPEMESGPWDAGNPRPSKHDESIPGILGIPDALEVEVLPELPKDKTPEAEDHPEAEPLLKACAQLLETVLEHKRKNSWGAWERQLIGLQEIPGQTTNPLSPEVRELVRRGILQYYPECQNDSIPLHALRLLDCKEELATELVERYCSNLRSARKSNRLPAPEKDP